MSPDRKGDSHSEHEVNLTNELSYDKNDDEEIQIVSNPFEQGGGDKMVVDFDHNQKIPVWEDEGHKMVAFDNGKQPVWSEDTQKVLVCSERDDKEILDSTPPLPNLPDNPKPKRIYGVRKRWFYAILISVLVLVVGLCVGLGVGLTTSHNTQRPVLASDYSIGGDLDAAYYSKTGAFNGSGISLASQSFPNGTVETVLYYQHSDGSLRWMRRQDLNGTGWEGGTISETVANDAKNNTPMSALSYTVNGTSIWHVFYIDQMSAIREKVRYNTTKSWTDGALANNSLTAFNSDMVGLQACWYGDVYNDTDYANSSTTTGIGMHFWYAIDEQTFQQLGWRLDDTEWTFQRNWTGMNGHAGVACYSWADPATTTWAMMVNQDNKVEIWGKNTDADSTVGAPLNVWTNTTPSGMSSVHPSTSLINVNLLYTQDDSTNLVKGYDVSWSWLSTSQDTWTVSVVDTFEIENHPGIPGTHMSATAIPNTDGGTSLWLMLQTVGDDISVFTRKLTGGNWTYSSVPIPDT